MTTVGSWTGREAKALRAALRLTILEFAEDLGVSPAAHVAAASPEPAAAVAAEALALARSTGSARTLPGWLSSVSSFGPTSSSRLSRSSSVTSMLCPSD